MVSAAVLAASAPAFGEYKVQIPLSTLGASGASGGGGGGGTATSDDDGDGTPNIADADPNGDGTNEHNDWDDDGIRDTADVDNTYGADENGDGIDDGVVSPGGEKLAVNYINIDSTDFQDYGANSSPCTASGNTCPTVIASKPSPNMLDMELDAKTGAYAVAGVIGVTDLGQMPEDANYIVYEDSNGAIHATQISESGGVMLHQDGVDASWDPSGGGPFGPGPIEPFALNVSGVEVVSFESVGFSVNEPAAGFDAAPFVPADGYEITSSTNRGIGLGVQFRYRQGQ